MVNGKQYVEGAEVLEELGLEASASSCERQGCASPPVWMPALIVHDDAGEKLATVALGMGLCGPHATMLEVSDVLDDESWEYICKNGFDDKNMPRPARERTRIAVYRVG